jgi:hypothetical protein
MAPITHFLVHAFYRLVCLEASRLTGKQQVGWLLHLTFVLVGSQHRSNPIHHASLEAFAWNEVNQWPSVWPIGVWRLNNPLTVMLAL